MKLRILGPVSFNNHLLERFEVYEIPDFDALEMVKYQLAEPYAGDAPAKSPGDPIPRPKAEIDHYVAEATETDPLKKKKLEEEGRLEEVLNDPKPVIEPTHEPELPVVTEDPEAKPEDTALVQPETPVEEVPETPVAPETPAEEEVVIDPATDGPVNPVENTQELPPDDSGISKEN